MDVLVIGGGINGAGIARDAAGRGLRTLLVEKDDLANHTSSASTKLVHGGLRYLEHYAFRLVRESLTEREVLLANAPHVIWPLEFVLPHDAGLRPKWMLRAGLFLYDHIGGRKSLPGSRRVDLHAPPYAAILQDRFGIGFAYSDCWVEDSRLVVLNAMDARARGADVRTRTRCVALARQDRGWRATLETGGGAREEVTARCVVNAAGPWVDELARLALGQRAGKHLRLVKGSHIIVPRKHGGEHAYIFQNRDGRIVFAIPYEHRFTLIGTTDRLFTGDLDAVAISPEERDYLCEAASEYFAQPVTAQDVVHSYAGVRPLYDDSAASNAAVTRDYVLDLDTGAGAGAGAGAPLLSVYGGKITTYRKLAEHALAALAPHLATGPAWTREAPLPGGDLARFDDFLEGSHARYPWVPPRMLLRLARAYGTNIDAILGRKASLAELGEQLGESLYAAEIDYLIAHEFAVTREDILWRRSKLGLHLDEREIARVDAYLARRT